MKNSAYVRFSVTLLLLAALLSPTAVLAGDGKKHFNKGMKYENAEEWDKAVEEFALAVADNPKNAEYRLHYTRSLFQASQQYMKKGKSLFEQKDYAGAYLAFRRAYAYDPVNELAKAEMDRMLRLQQGLQNGDDNGNNKTANTDGVKLVQTGYRQTGAQDVVMPQRLEKLRDVPFPGGVDLQFLIKELAKDLDLNVLFDSQTFRQGQTRKINIELKNVTAAKALDYIFLQENLFFQKVGPRTILVADQNRRQFYQQLVLRTFYLANADPTEVSKIIQSAIPAQPGRTPTIPLVDKATNSITIRDTTENIRIIGNLIKSLDKDRAEVVMDVQIFEVNKTDLLRLGNQIGGTVGNSNELVNLGGSKTGAIPFTGNFAANLATAIATGIILPSSTLSAFQSKNNTRLLASTQVHAFNGEKSSAKIGQRVPVKSATYVNTGANTGGNVPIADVINYEQTGLTLEFEPLVFPNQDVQVKMSIESRDLAGVGVNDNPIFGERTIKGSARIQNNRTMLLASVAQNRESNGKQGLPILGWIPIIGRLFATPTKDNSQVDIVIAVTPRVLRAPMILPEDEIERPTGSVSTPTSGSLEAMIVQEEIEEQLAAGRKIGNTANVQLPDRKLEDAPTYVKSTSANTTETKQETTEAQKPATDGQTASSTQNVFTDATAANLKPIDTGVKTLQITPTVDSADKTVATKETSLKSDGETANTTKPFAQLQILPTLSLMKAGEKTKLAVMVKSTSSFRSAVLGLRFDGKKVAVRSVSFGDVFGRDLANTAATPFINQDGKMFVSLSSAKDVAENSSGILAYIEIEALSEGKPEIAFETDVLSFLTADGKDFAVKF